MLTQVTATVRTMTIGVAALGLASCGGADDASGDDADAADSPAATAPSGGMPETPEGKTPGKISGTIAGQPFNQDGTCSKGPNQFEFWTDGTDFAVNSDTDGDGQFMVVQVITAGSTTMAAMRFHRDNEKVYNGTVPYSVGGNANMTISGDLGREKLISADLKINCG